MSRRYDVIVVGGRVAGAAAAMLLARAGARVLVLERGAPGDDTLSTHALMRAGVLQLSRWGLLPEVVAAGTPAVRIVSFHTGTDQTRITIKPGAGVEALYAPRRPVLDGILLAAAAAAGAEVRHHVRVTGLQHDATGRVTGVGVPGATLAARYVVGADGYASVVAQAVDAAATARGRSASAVRYAYFEGLDNAGYQWVYGDGAAAGFIPTNDGHHCVFVSTTPQRMRTLRLGRSAEDAFEAVLRLAAPGHVDLVRGSHRVSRLHGWAGAPGYLRRPWGEGWALVGDAGYFKDPISAHGMTDALRDGELAARAVLAGLTEPRAERRAFAGYEQRRDALSLPLFQVTDEIATYAWDASTIQPLLRRLSAAMTDEVEAVAALPPALSPTFAAAPG